MFAPLASQFTANPDSNLWLTGPSDPDPHLLAFHRNRSSLVISIRCFSKLAINCILAPHRISRLNPWIISIFDTNQGRCTTHTYGQNKSDIFDLSTPTLWIVLHVVWLRPLTDYHDIQSFLSSIDRLFQDSTWSQSLPLHKLSVLPGNPDILLAPWPAVRYTQAFQCLHHGQLHLPGPALQRGHQSPLVMFMTCPPRKGRRRHDHRLHT